MAGEHLATYLDDHLAGSMAALEHLRDLEQTAPAMAPALAELRCDIESDRKALESLIHRLGLTESRARQAGAWLAEKAARLKMRVDDRAGGPLRPLEGLEAGGARIHRQPGPRPAPRGGGAGPARPRPGGYAP